MIKGVLCDLDGFLVERFKTAPLPGVLDALAALRARGIPVAVATNQAGPLWRAVTGQEKYPTAEQVADRLLEATERLGLVQTSWYVSIFDDRILSLLSASELDDVLGGMPERLQAALVGVPAVVSADPTWRTPEPGMLLAACKAWDIQPSEAVYGGDRDSARQAAEGVGMRFIKRLPDVLALLDESEG